MRVTFEFLAGHAFPFRFFRRFHEERENAAQAEDLDEFRAVLFARLAVEGVIEHFEGPVSRHFLFSIKK